MLYTSGHRYMGGFIGSIKKEEEWIMPQVENWVRGVEVLVIYAMYYPGEA